MNMMDEILPLFNSLIYFCLLNTHTVEEARVYLVPSGLGDEEIVCFDPAGVACSVQKKGKEILLSKI